MKKTLIVPFVISLLLFSISQAALVDDAVSWAYTNNLTIHKTSKDFKVDQNIRRDEAAKFFVNFAKLVGKNVYVKTDSECKFSDIDQSWSDLKNVVVEACKLGIFQGSKGKFNPSGFLTQEQAVAVLIRIIDGYSPEISGRRSDLYYSRLYDLNLLKGFNHNNFRNQLTNRGYVINIIYNAREMKGVNSKYIITQDKEYLNSYDGPYFDIDNYPLSFCKDKSVIDQYKNYTQVKEYTPVLDPSFWSGGKFFNNLGRFKIGSDYEGGSDAINALALNFFDTRKDVSKCDYLSDLYNQILNGSYKIMNIKNLEQTNDIIQSMGSFNLKNYLSSCEESLKRVALVNNACNVLQNESISFDDFIHPVKDLVDGSFRKDSAKIPYKNGYIYYERDNSRKEAYLVYKVLDITAIYEFKTNNIIEIFETNPTYKGRLVGTVKKSDGTYPKLKYFGETISSELVISYIEGLLMGKQSSNYFTSQLNLFKLDIDKLYK